MNIKKLNTEQSMRSLPKLIVRPCEYGLRSAIIGLETQLGSIEAYNMLVDYSNKLRLKIEKGKGEAQNEMYATNPRGDS